MDYPMCDTMTEGMQLMLRKQWQKLILGWQWMQAKGLGTSLPHEKPAERTLSTPPPMNRQRVPDTRKVFVSGFKQMTHQDAQLLLTRCCNFGVTMQEVTLRTRVCTILLLVCSWSVRRVPRI
eukprot:2238786-Amphidinium_carterae.1